MRIRLGPVRRRGRRGRVCGGVVEEGGLAARVDVAVDGRGFDAAVANRAHHHGKQQQLNANNVGKMSSCVPKCGGKAGDWFQPKMQRKSQSTSENMSKDALRVVRSEWVI